MYKKKGIKVNSISKYRVIVKVLMIRVLFVLFVLFGRFNL